MLVLRKLGLTFVAAFVGILIPGLLGLTDQLTDLRDLAASQDALVALLFAAVIAGTRACLMFTTAFVPGDAQHGASVVGAYSPASKT